MKAIYFIAVGASAVALFYVIVLVLRDVFGDDFKKPEEDEEHDKCPPGYD